MRETLEAIHNGQSVGRMTYSDERITFAYTDEWKRNPDAFPLSLSMPLASDSHPDKVVRPFITGLLPDDPEVLRQWGKRFHVSDRNPFRLLSNVGEECAGAVQFIPLDQTSQWLADSPPGGIDWLNDEDLGERIHNLVRDRAAARQLGDEGQFSLAGAQTKTALYQDPTTGRWGIPKESIPTTHIIKPNRGDFEEFEINENYCLKLAAMLGLRTASSTTATIGNHPAIIVERYDRTWIGDHLIRIHQEDFCQALARRPDRKYQNEGGPSAEEIFELIRENSSAPQEDTLRFLDALIFNHLIGGTDAHAKNYSLLLGGGGQVRFAPLYDLISILPYPHQPKKVRLAMKIGGEYFLHKIGAHQWDKAADEWGLNRKIVREHLLRMASVLPRAATRVAKALGDNGEGVLPRLTEEISRRAESCLLEFKQTE